MGCLAPALAASIPWPLNIRTSRIRKIKGGVCAKLNDGNDPLLQAAINGVSLRFQETHLPEPLFLDPYAGCFIAPDAQKDMNLLSFSRSSTSHYCLATKFIDDKLLSTLNKMDGLRQVVLFTDGMDTRPYRLKWPNSTIIFDISPERVFQGAAQKLKDVGAKIPRSCLLVHVPSDSFDIQEILYKKGFNGNRPSIWALQKNQSTLWVCSLKVEVGEWNWIYVGSSFWSLQGLPLMTLENFKDIIILVSSFATKGCIFFGELPVWLVETEVAMKGLRHPDMQNWMDKFLMSNGFRVDVIAYDEVAREVGKDPPSGDCRNVLFVAEQLRLSDDQMESWRSEFQRVEEEGDEEGFEEI